MFDSDNGELSKPQLVAEIERPGFIAIHPEKKFLYATTPKFGETGNGGVAAFTINDDGTLTLLNKQSSKGRNPCHVSVDATGKCLLVANYSDGSVAALGIKEDGSLIESKSSHRHEGKGANPKRQEGPHAHSIYPNPDNTFAYAPDLGIEKVMIYKLNPNKATLTSAGHALVPGKEMGPRHMKFSNDGKHAYVLSELSKMITVFRPDSSIPGRLAYVTNVSTLNDGAELEGMSCSEVRIHPEGNYLYAANRDTAKQGRDSIAVFRSQKHKKGFRRIDVVPAEVSVPRNFNIDPSGKWMLVGGQASHDIAIFSLDPKTGKLKFTGRKVAFEGGPICIEFLH